MKRRSWTLVCVLTLSVFTACNKDENANSRYNQRDVQFVTKASMSNFAEITLGQLAADSAENDAIAAYGANMVSEHTAAQQQLSTIASSLGITITATLDQEHQLLRDSLLALDSTAFDSLYIHRQIADHDNAIRFFNQESAHGLQKDIKAYVFQVLPMLTLHLQSATTLSAQF